MKPYLGIVLLSGVAVGCSGGPREVKVAEPVVAKHNVRSVSKAGWRIEVWTSGQVFLEGPVGVGIRVISEDKKATAAPEITIIVRLSPKEKGLDQVREATIRPTLVRSIVPEGYLELIYESSGKLGEERPKFLSREGTWEALLEDPLQSTHRNGARPRPGHYLLAVEVSVPSGPNFSIQDLPVRFVASRDPADLK